MERTEVPMIDTESGGATYHFTEVNGTVYGWEYIDMVEADGSAHYIHDAPTLYDSSAATDGYHHFKVIAHTLVQTKFWESRPDSGYSVDNIAPSQPTGSKAEQSYNPEGLKRPEVGFRILDADWIWIQIPGWESCEPCFQPCVFDLHQVRAV